MESVTIYFKFASESELK